MIIKNGEKKIEKKNLDKKDIFAHNVQKVFAAKICGSSSFAELSGRKIPGWFFYTLLRREFWEIEIWLHDQMNINENKCWINCDR